MSFYNPYMRGPDFGAGVSGLTNKIMQMLMMQKMYKNMMSSRKIL